MEAVQGCSKTVTFPAAVACEDCGGSGVPPGTRPESCKRCKGSGMTYMQTGPFRMQTTCTHCGGTGKTFPVAAIGLDPSKHLGKEITSLHNCICRLYGSSGCGEGGEYETLTLNCLLFVNHNH